MAKNRNLHKAKANKKDEFYTQLADIENEIKHYREHFRGKVVYCNCDDPTVSNFYRYFKLNFEFLELKKLITTCYKSQQMDMFSQHDIDTAIGIEYNGARQPDSQTARQPDSQTRTYISPQGRWRFSQRRMY